MFNDKHYTHIYRRKGKIKNKSFLKAIQGLIKKSSIQNA